MRAIVITTDPVLLSFAKSVLADAGLEADLTDQFTSSIEGSVGILPSRLMVRDEVWDAARMALVEAGLAADVVPPDAASERSGEGT